MNPFDGLLNWMKTLTDAPGANVPEVTVHEYGSVPPEAVSVDEYADPTVPFGNEAVVIFTVLFAFMLISNTTPAP